ncbi:MAG: hydroxymethylbilane synthase [Micrococcales bacterium]|nr:hydroxymethylbilane synthase [Micrococcales bacterium]
MAVTVYRLGTRGSALATTQSGHVAQALGDLGVVCQLVVVRTTGDVNRASLAQMGGTGVFAAELRAALLAGDCDLAVHSLKDLPVAQPDGLVIAAVPVRVDPSDVLCAADGARLADLPPGAKVGTGSPRRAAQLADRRPDLDIRDLRGNVDTRLARVHGPDADLDAVVLARAGLERLGRLEVVTEVLDLLPAPGQGALAVEVRTADDTPLTQAVRALDHPASRQAVVAERAVLGRLGAGCSAPVGALARRDGTGLRLTAVLGTSSGLITRTAAVPDSGPDSGPDPAAAEALGVRVADDLLAAAR